MSRPATVWMPIVERTLHHVAQFSAQVGVGSNTSGRGEHIGATNWAHGQLGGPAIPLLERDPVMGAAGFEPTTTRA
jgi:hypothetical protein